jgi:hypothetical protein
MEEETVKKGNMGHHMSITRTALLLVAMMSAAAAHSGTVDDAFGKVDKTFSGWEVHVKADPMTDKKECVALPHGNMRVQGSPRMLAISFKGKGGVKGYEYRIDDRPASSMQLASDIERDVGAVVFENDALTQILSGKRLRVQVVPVLRGLLFEDIDTNGLASAVQYMRDNHC